MGVSGVSFKWVGLQNRGGPVRLSALPDRQSHSICSQDSQHHRMFTKPGKYQTVGPLNIAFHMCAESSPCHISFTPRESGILSLVYTKEAKTRIISSCIHDPPGQPLTFLGSRGLINGDETRLLCRRKAFHIKSALAGESLSKSLPSFPTDFPLMFCIRGQPMSAKAVPFIEPRQR